MKEVEIYTDGSCRQQEGKGGWAYLIVVEGKIKEKNSKFVSDTTNNRCEMLAAINGLSELDLFGTDIKATVFSDSAYLVNAFNDGWIQNWQSNGWKNAEKKDVINQDLWLELIELKKNYNIDFVKIPRKSNEFAIMVDGLAKKASNERV